jgi:hypothetical protein
MGCWNETCGITRLPILAGDPVVMVVLAKGTVGADLFTGIFPNHIEQIHCGMYSDYGWIADLPGADLRNPGNHYQGDTPYERAIFFARPVWDAIVANGNPSAIQWAMDAHELEVLRHRYGDGDPPRSEETWRLLCQLTVVLCYCRSIRTDPTSGLAFKGSQARDTSPYLELLHRIQEQLRRL